MILIPVFVIFVRMRWIDSLFLGSVYVVRSERLWYILLVRQHVITIPKDLDDAALIDGCRLSRAEVKVHPHKDMDARLFEEEIFAQGVSYPTVPEEKDINMEINLKGHRKSKGYFK